MTSSPLNETPVRTDLRSLSYPLINSADPFFSARIDGDESHASLISKQFEYVYGNVKSTPSPLNQTYILSDMTPHESPSFINTCEIFPDFDPQLLQIQYKNEDLIGIDSLRDDEGLDKENDDAKRESYYNEDYDSEDDSSPSSVEYEKDSSNYSPSFFSIIHNNGIRLRANSGHARRPLRRITTPNLAPQKPLVCNQKNCHESFRSKNDYKKHLKSHTVLKFQCPYHVAMPNHKGKHIFNRMDVWKRHLRTFHFEFNPGQDSNQGLGICRVCGEFFEYFNIFADEHIEHCAKRLRHQLKA
jgi:hypothetical protein